MCYLFVDLIYLFVKDLFNFVCNFLFVLDMSDVKVVVIKVLKKIMCKIVSLIK